MRTFNINLHLRRKSTVRCVTAFVAAFLLITLVVCISVGADMSQLNALLRSKYEYSAIAQSGMHENTYYQYSAGISFALTEDSQTRFNVEVLMQTEKGEYSDTVYWNSERLDSSSVAISKSIADSHGLAIGDVIYSKHIVDGITRGYTINKVLPAITTARVSDNSNHNNGVIIMGYDAQYAANISHTYMIFTNDPIEVITVECSEMPINILYRDNEIALVTMQAVPYLTIYILASAALIIGVVIFLTKSVACNFKRLAACGADFHAMNRSYYKITIGIGAVLILLSGIISTIAFGMAGIYAINTAPVLAVVTAELIALIAAAITANKNLWRK